MSAPTLHKTHSNSITKPANRLVLLKEREGVYSKNQTKQIYSAKRRVFLMLNKCYLPPSTKLLRHWVGQGPGLSYNLNSQQKIAIFYETVRLIPCPKNPPPKPSMSQFNFSYPYF
jgi:hypothetical protein